MVNNEVIYTLNKTNTKGKVLDITSYFEETREVPSKSKSKSMDVKNIMWSWIGSFLGIMIISNMHNYLQLLSRGDFSLMIGSFGATAVLAYGATDSPLAQPKNIIGGHILSAIVGVTAFKVFGGNIWFASAVAVSTSITLMQITKTLHPPGGATALIAVIGGSQIHSLGYIYPIAPVGVGATVMVLIAIFINKISGRKYPNM